MNERKQLIPYAGKEESDAYWRKRRMIEGQLTRVRAARDKAIAEIARLEALHRDLYGVKDDN